jgi:hypothetical protein
MLVQGIRSDQHTNKKITKHAAFFTNFRVLCFPSSTWETENSEIEAENNIASEIRILSFMMRQTSVFDLRQFGSLTVYAFGWFFSRGFWNWWWELAARSASRLEFPVNHPKASQCKKM